MDYSLEIEKLRHPLLKSLLFELLPIFQAVGVQFYVVGATARDILMELNGVEPTRRTRDLDLAIAIDDWEKFREIENEILQNSNFKKDKKQRQRFVYLDDFEIDLIPFGDIANKENKIFWPPTQDIAMSVLGYHEAWQTTHTVTLGDIQIKVASLEAIFLLKLFAWKDRHTLGNKDASDLGFILQNYLNINIERAVESHYQEIYERDDYSELVGAAILLAFDISKLLRNSEITRIELKKIIEHELKLKEESPLFNQIIETNRISYDEVFTAFSLFNQYFK